MGPQGSWGGNCFFANVNLAILYSTADCSTTAARIFIPFAGGCWARYQLSNGIRYVSIASKLRKSLPSVEGVLGIKLAIFYSMADYSTTARWILMLFAGGCWARHQLPSGIHQQKLILRLRRGRRVRTHPTSFFRPLRPQRPDAIPNADCVLT